MPLSVNTTAAATRYGPGSSGQRKTTELGGFPSTLVAFMFSAPTLPLHRAVSAPVTLTYSYANMILTEPRFGRGCSGRLLSVAIVLLKIQAGPYLLTRLECTLSDLPTVPFRGRPVLVR